MLISICDSSYTLAISNPQFSRWTILQLLSLSIGNTSIKQRRFTAQNHGTFSITFIHHRVHILQYKSNESTSNRSQFKAYILHRHFSTLLSITYKWIVAYVSELVSVNCWSEFSHNHLDIFIYSPSKWISINMIQEQELCIFIWPTN